MPKRGYEVSHGHREALSGKIRHIQGNSEIWVNEAQMKKEGGGRNED
jgi:hypothetical protein